MSEREKEQNNQREGRRPDLTLRREEFEKFMFFLHGFLNSIPFKPNKQMRVVMIYDPHKPKVRFYNLTDEEQLDVQGMPVTDKELAELRRLQKETAAVRKGTYRNGKGN